ncbi:HAMP domain-containing sensor histidine kinase [Intestinimonas butyriciproducens]|uniref:HAMP domain-containing sensor histidine kinase n=1 Tax=Intestinimonas butyriciproducens TaxID=1297617 RepID=UPI00195E3A7C|nr:HAMP domain-containing sensor histidine kinase [Intestinimonas butyriciproducens]MBM6974975.1 HAMP domain-containing histidine kinase [Intestinimonas butyriciproducens]
MNKVVRWISKRLGVKFLAVSAIALICAGLGHYLVADVIAEWFFYDSRFDTYWESKSETAVQGFQEYVTEKGLTMRDALADTKWHQENPDIIIFTEPAASVEETQSEVQYISIHCADGIIYATSYFPGDTYFFGWNTAGILFGLILFLGIVLPFVVCTIHRINKLYQQVLSSAQSGRSQSIMISGKDEIAELGNEIESMRISLLNLLDNEEQLRKESDQLVASLSHDIRTPLTKLTGYLEILLHKKELTNEDHEVYLAKAVEKARQLKILTDELFNKFVMENKDDPQYIQELIDIGQFLNQLLYEECSELEEDGFLIAQFSSLDLACFCRLHIGDVHRAFDNIFSNLRKYADPRFPITIRSKLDQNKICVIIENHKKACLENVVSHKIGLMTAKTLVEKNEGWIDITQNPTSFSVSISFPAVETCKS